MTKGDTARELFFEGYNCAQSVLCTYATEIGIDFETAARIAAPFGGGMGRMREVCGAFSGMIMAVGMKYGYSDPNEFDKKTELYQTVQELADRFREKNGSIICRELLGIASDAALSPIPERRTDGYYRKRPCPEIVKSAAELLEEYI